LNAPALRMSNDSLYAGVDFGTSGCRLVLIDRQKNQVYHQQQRYPHPEKQSPEVWWESLSQLLLACPVNLKQKLAAIAIDGTSGTLLLADKEGNPSSCNLMYNDARARDEAKLVSVIAPPESGAQGTSSSLARLMWLLKHYPNAPHRYVLHQADWIMGKLANNYGHSDENNCLKLGYDSVKGQWPAWFADLSIPLNVLPEVHKPASNIATVDEQIAQQFALPLNLAIVTGTTDSIAAFIATGATKVGEAVTSLGSTLAIKLISDTPIFAPEYGVYSHRLGGNWLIGGASNSGGAVLLKYFSPQQLTAMTPLLKPDSPTSLSYYPLLKTGERFPFADPDKKARLTPRPENDILYFQGILEGIAEIEAQAYQRLAELGAPELRAVYSVGGGSKNTAWTTIRQHKLQIKMKTPDNTDAAYGVALLAREGSHR